MKKILRYFMVLLLTFVVNSYEVRSGHENEEDLEKTSHTIVSRLSDEALVYLSDEALVYIFSFLPPKSLVTQSAVCKQWHFLMRDEVLWKNLFKRVGIFEIYERYIHESAGTELLTPFSWFQAERKKNLKRLSSFFDKPSVFKNDVMVVRTAAFFGSIRAMRERMSISSWKIQPDDPEGFSELGTFVLYEYYPAYEEIATAYHFKKFGLKDSLTDEERARRGIETLRRYIEVNPVNGIEAMLAAYGLKYHGLDVKDQEYSKYANEKQKRIKLLRDAELERVDQHTLWIQEQMLKWLRDKGHELERIEDKK